MLRMTMMVLVLALSACATLESVAPRTVAGFRTGGILGALDGATGAILARCRRYDGTEFRIALETLAVETGAGDNLVRLREKRLSACRAAGAISVLTGG
ncbi:MAG: hypothetical protein AAF908_12435 [Pseudomonadota bacterium]